VYHAIGPDADGDWVANQWAKQDLPYPVGAVTTTIGALPTKPCARARPTNRDGPGPLDKVGGRSFRASETIAQAYDPTFRWATRPELGTLFVAGATKSVPSSPGSRR